MNIVGTYEKQPAEEKILSVDFTADLEDGATVSSHTATATDESGNDVTSTIIAVSTLSTPVVSFTVQGGTDGQKYTVSIVATLSDGQEVEADVVVVVREVTFGSAEVGIAVSEILALATKELPTSKEEGNYTLDAKLDGLNEALRIIKSLYKPEQFYAEDTVVAFTNGVADAPDDYDGIWVKLYPSGLADQPWTRRNLSDFDELSGEYWTERMIPAGSTYLRRLYVAVTPTTTMYLRYVPRHTTITDVTNRLPLPDFWRDGLAKLTAANVFRYAQETGKAERLRALAHSDIRGHLGVMEEKKEEPRYHRAKSVYEGVDLFLGSR